MSNSKCCVPGCENSSGSKETLHKFPNPVKNKDLFNTWVYAVGGHILGLKDDHIFKYRRVCHKHFEEKYWCYKNRLSNIAVPTKNLPGFTVGKFDVNESSVLRPMRNISPEASTSKGLSAPMFGESETSVLRPIENIMFSKASTSKGLSAPMFGENESSVSRPIENIMFSEASTSKGVAAKKLQPDVETIDMQENIETAAVTRLPVSVSPKPVPQKTVKEVKETLQPVPSQKKSLVEVRKKLRKRIAVTPAEKSLYRRLMLTSVKLSKCRNKVKRQTAKMRALKCISTNPYLMKTLDSLPSTAKILTMMQFREHKKKNKGQRFTLKEKLVALSIQKQSPKGYRFLRRIFVLPSPQTLVKLLNMADIRPGINDNMREQIKKATEKMKAEHRLCIVLFDEMSLMPSVTYNERKDRVSGFVTNGFETRLEFADHAQVFMIRGLLKNYKQPVAYTFSQAATKGPELAMQLKAVVTELQNAGLIVVATVCDQGTNNAQCYKILTQETRGILLRRGEEPKNNIILINDKEIVPLYDPPHLMKCVRNNLITKNLKYKKDGETKEAKWSHITCLHNENPGYKGVRLVPKLTDLHCVPAKIPKMKVKYATQLFSQTVASNMGYLADKGILPTESKDTADILLFFDKLFDSLNGSYEKKNKKYGKPLLGPATPKSCHHQFWQDAKKKLRQLEFVNLKTNKIEYVPTLKNWVWTLEGIEVLLSNLESNYGVSSVWLRHLNQDPIENFFGSIRSHGCRNTNPTPDRFESAFATLLVNSLSSAHAPGANCELDNCIALHEAIITGTSTTRNNPEINIPEITITPLEEKNSPQIIGGLQYISGYFLKKANQNVFKGCNQCKNDLFSENELEYIGYREYANKKWLHNPSDSLLLCISSLQDINYAIIKENLHNNNLKELIKTVILMFTDFDFIKCEIHKEDLIDFLINISCRFYIYNYCKDLNKILANRRDCDDDEDELKLKAKKYATKCIKRKISK